MKHAWYLTLGYTIRYHDACKYFCVIIALNHENITVVIMRVFKRWHFAYVIPHLAYMIPWAEGVLFKVDASSSWGHFNAYNIGTVTARHQYPQKYIFLSFRHVGLYYSSVIQQSPGTLRGTNLFWLCFNLTLLLQTFWCKSRRQLWQITRWSKKSQWNIWHELLCIMILPMSLIHAFPEKMCKTRIGSYLCEGQLDMGPGLACFTHVWNGNRLWEFAYAILTTGNQGCRSCQSIPFYAYSLID